jgi:hypothetical protein
MMKHLNILLSVLLVALFAGGCNNEVPETIDDMLGPPCLFISFIDSEGRDLVTGIPTIKLVVYPAEYDGDFLSTGTFRVKPFINEEASSQYNLHMQMSYKDGVYELYDAINFVFWDLHRKVNDKSSSTVYTIRCEVVCEYIFGNDETHIMTGELSRLIPGGTYDFLRFWFDGVEIPPALYPPGLDMAYPADGRKENAFIVQLNR